MLGFLKGIGKVAGGLLGIGGGNGIDYGKLSGAIGAALGNSSDAMAANRGSAYDGQIELARLLNERDRDYNSAILDREKEGREGTAQAWKQLLAAQRFMQPSSRPSLSPYSTARREVSPGGNAGAEALLAQAMARLTGGNQLPMPERSPLNVDPNLLKAGTGEKVTGWLGPILSGIGGINRRPTSQGAR